MSTNVCLLTLYVRWYAFLGQNDKAIVVPKTDQRDIVGRRQKLPQKKKGNAITLQTNLVPLANLSSQSINYGPTEYLRTLGR